jgi:hypothetical protein
LIASVGELSGRNIDPNGFRCCTQPLQCPGAGGTIGEAKLVLHQGQRIATDASLVVEPLAALRPIQLDCNAALGSEPQLVRRGQGAVGLPDQGGGEFLDLGNEEGCHLAGRTGERRARANGLNAVQVNQAAPARARRA